MERERKACVVAIYKCVSSFLHSGHSIACWPFDICLVLVVQVVVVHDLSSSVMNDQPVLVVLREAVLIGLNPVVVVAAVSEVPAVEPLLIIITFCF